MQAKTVLRYVLTICFVLLLAVLQTTVLHAAELFGVIPNLLLSAVVCYSLTKGDYKAHVFGIGCGLLLDFFGGRVVGMNTLLCFYVSLVCVLLYGGLFNNNVFVAMLFVLLLSVPYEFFIYFFSLFIWGQGDIVYALLCKIVPCAVYNALTTFLVYPFTRALAVEWTEKSRPGRKRMRLS